MDTQQAPLHVVATPPTLASSQAARFHLLRNAVSAHREIMTAQAGSVAGDVLELMLTYNYSQVPVLKGNVVIGVLSFRSFASRAKRLQPTDPRPQALPVEECLEQARFVSGDEDLSAGLEQLDKQDVVLLGNRKELGGLATGIDLLRYFYAAASPFVFLGEIEGALRELMRRAVSDDELAACLARAFPEGLSPDGLPIPQNLNEMSFDEYRRIVCDGRNWELFKPLFGGDRKLTEKRLSKARNLRNDVCHFRRELTEHERKWLTNLRNHLYNLVLASAPA